MQQVVSQYKSMSLKVQDKNDKYQLVSLVSFATQEGYDTARSCAVEIIKYNIELEEKDRLFKEKVRELETLFRNESLDKLKEINCECSEDIRREIYWVYNIVQACYISIVLLFAIIALITVLANRSM